jgi:hypothetical protein
MTQLLAIVKAALQLLPAHSATAWFLEVAWLAVKLLLATSTPFLDKERTLGACYVSRVAVVLDRRVSTAGPAQAVEAAIRRACTARLGRLKDGSAAIATDLGEDGFGATGAWAAMTDLLAFVAATLQLSAASLDTDVLCFYRC